MDVELESQSSSERKLWLRRSPNGRASSADSAMPTSVESYENNNDEVKQLKQWFQVFWTIYKHFFKMSIVQYENYSDNFFVVFLLLVNTHFLLVLEQLKGNISYNLTFPHSIFQKIETRQRFTFFKRLTTTTGCF